MVTRMMSILPPNFGSSAEVEATHDDARRRPMGGTPLEPRNSKSDRGDWIRTSDPLRPRQVRPGNASRPPDAIYSYLMIISAAGSALEPFGYGAEEPPAFCPRTHAALIFQSGSSWDLNCLPPWWVSARPPTSGASGIRRNRLCSGLPGVTSFETV